MNHQTKNEEWEKDEWMIEMIEWIWTENRERKIERTARQVWYIDGMSINDFVYANHRKCLAKKWKSNGVLKAVV